MPRQQQTIDEAETYFKVILKRLQNHQNAERDVKQDDLLLPWYFSTLVEQFRLEERSFQSRILSGCAFVSRYNIERSTHALCFFNEVKTS